jgi:hypothetical protein
MSCIQQCSLSLSNTGSECVPVFDITDKIWFTRKYGADGTKNRITIASLEAAIAGGTEDTFFSAMMNAVDASTRVYPVGSFKNVADEREDAKYFDWEDGSKYFLEDGVRTFNGLIPNGAPQLKSRIESFRGFEVSAYYVTKSNQLVGKVSADGLYFEPIDLEAPSIAAKFTKRGSSSPQSLGVRFDVKSTENDSSLRLIDCSEVGEVTLGDYRGLLDAIVAISDISNQGFTATFTADWGTPMNPYLITGLLAADFRGYVSGTASRIYNEDDTADVTISSVTESTDGVYEITFAAEQDEADVLLLKLSASGYDFTVNVNGTEIVIPTT